jgi:GNAT superfamily N-acetyltransferase
MKYMLFRLYDLPDHQESIASLRKDGITIRRALAAEKSIVIDWVAQHFGTGWASETEVSFSCQPVACFIATKDAKVVGFGCYDSAYRNFFGPTGVEEILRGKGIGKVLLLECLQAMKAQGYAYGIIAVLIEGSNPGIYEGIMSEIPVE